MKLTSHDETWAIRFREVYDRVVEKYHAGERGTENLVTSDEAKFLASIGCIAQELYDFVEDWVEAGEPTFDVALCITGVRRDYFLKEQRGQPSVDRLTMNAVPPKEATLGGFTWLPRIIAKAKAKLRGELPPELMYSCGADRRFLESIGADPVDFLRVIWEAANDDQKALDYVKEKAQGTSRRTSGCISRFMSGAGSVRRRMWWRILKSFSRLTNP